MRSIGDQLGLIGRVVERGFVDIEDDRGLRRIDDGALALALGQCLPGRIGECAVELGGGGAVGLAVDQIVLDGGLGPGDRVEVVIRGGETAGVCAVRRLAPGAAAGRVFDRQPLSSSASGMAIRMGLRHAEGSANSLVGRSFAEVYDMRVTFPDWHCAAPADRLRGAIRPTSSMPNTPSILPLRVAQASYVLAAISLWLVLYLHLLPVLLAGLLVYALVNSLAPSLQRHLPGTRAHWLRRRLARPRWWSAC